MSDKLRAVRVTPELQTIARQAKALVELTAENEELRATITRLLAEKEHLSWQVEHPGSGV